MPSVNLPHNDWMMVLLGLRALEDHNYIYKYIIDAIERQVYDQEH